MKQRDFVSGGVFANGDNRTDDDLVERRYAALHRQLRAVADEIAERSGKPRLPAGRRQRSAEPAALLGRPTKLIFGGFQTYDDETSWNYEAGVKVTRSRYTFNAAVFTTRSAISRSRSMPAAARRASSFNVPEAHASGVEVEFGWEPMDGPAADVRRQLDRSRVRLDGRDGG